MAWVKTEKTNALNRLADVNITNPEDGNSIVYDATNGVWINGEGGGGGNSNELELSSQDYEALTPAEKINGTNYFINDISPAAQSAAGTPYDNSVSDLVATDVQDAIDELVINDSGILLNIANIYSNSSTYAVGDFCIFNGQLYKCNTAISTAEAFNSIKWTATTVMAEILLLAN